MITAGGGHAVVLDDSLDRVGHREDSGAVHDPREGVAADGTIRTGVDRSRVPAVFEPVVAALVDAVPRTWEGAPVSLLLYGSVTTGTATAPGSDVDAVTVGLPASEAAAVGARLSERFAALCRGVEVGAGQPADHEGDDDEARGNRVFLRHYCLLLAGPDLAAGWGPFPADARAARGFNGDVAEHLVRWRARLEAIDGTRDAAGDVEVAALQRRVARKALLAVAGLVSVHDRTWTTDRSGAARRWAQLHPADAEGLERLSVWAETSSPSASPVTADRDALVRALGDGGAVAHVVDAFRRDVGLWTRPS